MLRVGGRRSNFGIAPGSPPKRDPRSEQFRSAPIPNSKADIGTVAASCRITIHSKDQRSCANRLLEGVKPPAPGGSYLL